VLLDDGRLIVIPDIWLKKEYCPALHTKNNVANLSGAYCLIAKI